jgi:hypothetical protein
VFSEDNMVNKSQVLCPKNIQADIIEQAASMPPRRAEQVDQSVLVRAFRGGLG